MTAEILTISSDEYAIVYFHEISGTTGSFQGINIDMRFDGNTKSIRIRNGVDGSIESPFSNKLLVGLEELRMPPGSNLYVTETGSGSQTIRVHATVEVYSKVS